MIPIISITRHLSNLPGDLATLVTMRIRRDSWSRKIPLDRSTAVGPSHDFGVRMCAMVGGWVGGWVVGLAGPGIVLAARLSRSFRSFCVIGPMYSYLPTTRARDLFISFHSLFRIDFPSLAHSHSYT